MAPGIPNCCAAAFDLSVYPACTSVGGIRCFWRFSGLIESVTYLFSVSLLVRSPPPLPTNLFPNNNLAVCRGGKRRQGASRVAPTARKNESLWCCAKVGCWTSVARPDTANALLHFPKSRPTSESPRVWEQFLLAHLDILLEALYLHLECLPKNNASASSCCRGPWTC